MVPLLLLLASASGPADPSASSIPKPIGSLSGLITGDDYPRQAMERGEQGKVDILVRVDDQGSISDCIVEQSSGFSDLDARTCELIRERAKFKPALDPQGRAIPSEMRTQIGWSLRDGPQPNQPWVHRIVASLGPGRQVLSCQTESNLSPTPNQKETVEPCDDEMLQFLPEELSEAPASATHYVQEQRFAPGPSADPVLRPGEILVKRTVLNLQIDANGQLQSCKPADSGMPNSEVASLCEHLGNQFAPRAGSDGKPAPFEASMTWTVIVRLGAK